MGEIPYFLGWTFLSSVLLMSLLDAHLPYWILLCQSSVLSWGMNAFTNGLEVIPEIPCLELVRGGHGSEQGTCGCTEGKVH